MCCRSVSASQFCYHALSYLSRLAHSVPIRYLQDYSQIPTICKCCICYSCCVIGMDLPSYVYTLTRHSIFLKRSRGTLAVAFNTLSQMFVHTLGPRNYRVKPKLDDDAKHNKIRSNQTNPKVPHLDSAQKSSTFKHTNYMLWRIIHRKLECMVPWIHIQCNLYVSLFIICMLCKIHFL